MFSAWGWRELGTLQQWGPARPGQAACLSWQKFESKLRSRRVCCAGQTRSEGGFKPNKVQSVSVLDYGSKEKDGKTYYTYELLSRTGAASCILP